MTEARPSGFLHRWSRLKTDAREREMSQEAQSDSLPDPLPEAPGAPVVAGVAGRDLERAEGRPDDLAFPTMDDVRQLSSDSDFSRFVARGVAPDVKNAALKKLFSDPHYNVMDGLDTYVDDYSRQTPLPQSALRKMTISKAIDFFGEEARGPAAALPQGEPACPAREYGGEPQIDHAKKPDAPDAIASALPAPTDAVARPAYTDVPEPATRSKP